MYAVFISSAQSGYESMRAAAKEAVERMNMRALMAETAPASPHSPRRAVFDLIEQADVFVLLLAPRYGAAGPGGVSPTEDEFNEAVRLRKPIIAFVTEEELEPEQDAFLSRVRGHWEQGRLYETFLDYADLKVKLMSALNRLSAPIDEGARAAASERAQALVRDPYQGRAMHSGVPARVALVPVGAPRLLDELALEEPDLEDELIGMARSSGLVGQRVGLAPSTSSDGVTLTGHGDRNWETIAVVVGTDGAVMAQRTVAGEGVFGGSIVDPDLFYALVQTASDYAMDVWARIDRRDQVREAAVVAAVHEAQHKVFGSVSGNRMNMSMRMPDLAVAPRPPMFLARADVGSAGHVERMVAAMRRVFADGGALHS